MQLLITTHAVGLQDVLGVFDPALSLGRGASSWEAQELLQGAVSLCAAGLEDSPAQPAKLGAAKGHSWDLLSCCVAQIL